MIEYKVKVDENGTQAWYLNGKLHREDGPTVIWKDGSKEWYLNGKLHREDGPAIEYSSGTQAWYLNGKLHREDGPAVIYSDGTQAWSIKGEKLTEEQFNSRNVKELTIEQLQKLLGYKIKVVE